MLLDVDSVLMVFRSTDGTDSCANDGSLVFQRCGAYRT